jgi:hypothetical protein
MRTQVKLDELVHALQSNCGDMFDACRRCSVSLVFVQAWMKDDKDVAAALIEAERVGALALQSAAIQRAVHGVEKGVYFKGERVDSEIQYSDGLLQTLLKARLPETFGKEGEGAGNTFNGPTQINIMPRANTYDEWLQMRDKTLDRRDKMDAADKAEGRLEGGRPSPLLPYIELEAVPVPAAPFEGLGL